MSVATDKIAPAILSIGDSDTSGAQGVQQDAFVAAKAGVGLLTAVTAITWQRDSVRRVMKVAPKVVAAQIDAALRDSRAAACTVGAMPSDELVNAVMGRLRRRSAPNVVLHPVLRSADGQQVLGGRGIARILRYLSLAEVVVVDMETALLLTLRVSREDVAGGYLAPGRSESAASDLLHNGAKMVVLRGGGPAGADFVYDGNGVRRLENAIRRPGWCGFLSALVAIHLARGASAAEAVGAAMGEERGLGV